MQESELDIVCNGELPHLTLLSVYLKYKFQKCHAVDVVTNFTQKSQTPTDKDPMNNIRTQKGKETPTCVYPNNEEFNHCTLGKQYVPQVYVR